MRVTLSFQHGKMAAPPYWIAETHCYDLVERSGLPVSIDEPLNAHNFLMCLACGPVQHRRA